MSGRKGYNSELCIYGIMEGTRYKRAAENSLLKPLFFHPRIMETALHAATRSPGSSIYIVQCAGITGCGHLSAVPRIRKRSPGVTIHACGWPLVFPDMCDMQRALLLPKAPVTTIFPLRVVMRPRLPCERKSCKKKAYKARG